MHLNTAVRADYRTLHTAQALFIMINKFNRPYAPGIQALIQLNQAARAKADAE